MVVETGDLKDFSLRQFHQLRQRRHMLTIQTVEMILDLVQVFDQQIPRIGPIADQLTQLVAQTGIPSDPVDIDCRGGRYLSASGPLCNAFLLICKRAGLDDSIVDIYQRFTEK